MTPLPWAATAAARTLDPTADVVVQVSRLQLRRWRDVPGFLRAAMRLRQSVLDSEGAVGVSLLAQPLARTFWTLSAWRDDDAIRAFVRSPGHVDAMRTYRNRMHGSHFHTWTVTAATQLPPDWRDARARLVADEASGHSGSTTGTATSSR